jgi:hypothetical protein
VTKRLKKNEFGKKHIVLFNFILSTGQMFAPKNLTEKQCTAKCLLGR